MSTTPSLARNEDGWDYNISINLGQVAFFWLRKHGTPYADVSMFY